MTGGHGRTCGLCGAVLTAYTHDELDRETDSHFADVHPEVER